jgi:acyl dehydratase
MKEEAEKKIKGKEVEWTEATTKDEFYKQVDAWLKRREKQKGEVHIPQLGVWPPDARVSYVAGLNNEQVTQDLIRHYADAIGDKNPLWRNEEYARRTRWGGIIAPPTFMDCIAPTFVGSGRDYPRGMRPLVAGAKRTWYQVMRPGDKIHCVDRYVGVEEKTSKDKPYRLFVETTKRTYLTQREEVVAEADCPIVTVAAGTLEKTSSAYPFREKTKYTQEQLEKVHNGYETETRRGAKTLFWEEVVEGEELTPIVAGPLDATDNLVFMAALQYMPAFGLKWDIIKADPTWATVNPETNEYHSGCETHLVDWIAKLRVGANAYGLAALSEGLVCHLVTNWMGDDGFLKKLECRQRRLNHLGDVSWMKGKVIRKYIENGEHLVDLEVYCQNQVDIIHMDGKATVMLLSHDVA